MSSEIQVAINSSIQVEEVPEKVEGRWTLIISRKFNFVQAKFPH